MKAMEQDTEGPFHVLWHPEHRAAIDRYLELNRIAYPPVNEEDAFRRDQERLLGSPPAPEPPPPPQVGWEHLRFADDVGLNTQASFKQLAHALGATPTDAAEFLSYVKMHDDRTERARHFELNGVPDDQAGPHTGPAPESAARPNAWAALPEAEREVINRRLEQLPAGLKARWRPVVEELLYDSSVVDFLKRIASRR
jgi:hypothetical protein